MRPFLFDRAATVDAAVKAAATAERKIASDSPEKAADATVHYLAGGTTLIDLMKLDVIRPQRVIDINPLERVGQYGKIEVNAQGVRLGGLVRMADAARNSDLKRDYPLIVQALELAASPQLRNMASLAGNVLQRTRCNYFRDPSWTACNKRNPGSGCAALDGFNRRHAVLGTSDSCIATYPGDFAQALVALDANVEIAGAGGPRVIRFADLHKLPGGTPSVETVLRPGDLITAFSIEAGPWTRRSLFLKIWDRQSYEFALASAAVALDISEGLVRQARIALGGVATVPWRAHDAEAALAGKRLDETSAQAAADAAFAAATPHRHNGFKIQLGKATLVRALLQASTMEV